MPLRTALSQRPLSFSAESSKERRQNAPAFRGRVPVVFAFVGAHGPQADTAITALDRALIHFAQRCIQLLVVVDAHPSEVAARLGVSVPLITDDGLAEDLNAQPDDHGRLSSVILGNDGHVIDVVRQLHRQDRASAILLAVDRLATEFPDRFGVLRDMDDNAEAIDDPTDTVADDDDTSFPQRLSWLIGDRASEAKALADTVGAPPLPTETVLVGKKRSHRRTLGDSSMAERVPITRDVANRGGMLEKLHEEERDLAPQT